MARSASYRSVHGTPHPPNFAFNLAAIAALVALVAVGAAYVVDDLRHRTPQHTEPRAAGPTIEKTVGGQKLAIPPAWFRFEDQRQPGFAERVDLLFALPLGPDGAMTEVEVTLTPRSRARPSARLLDAVYLHKFRPEQVTGPPGLVGKPLRGTDGFQNETVWYDPLATNPFVAKCMASPATGEPDSCLRTAYVGEHVAATYVFDATVLASWKRFDGEADRWLARIGGLASPSAKES